MFIHEFRSEFLHLADLQLAVGIALDNLLESNAAEYVIAMYLELNDYKNAKFPTRDLLEEFLLTSQTGLAESYVAFLYSENCIAYSRSGRNYAKKELVSLSKLLKKSISKKQLLVEVLHIVLSNDSRKFIYLYAGTEMFKRHLREYLTRTKSLTSRSNTAEIVSEIISDFMNYIDKYSSNGSYNTASCTPYKFLINAFQNFYLPSGSAYRIINARSLMRNVSSGNTLSLLDYHSVYEDSVDIDFISIAEKICESSISLYNHNGKRDVAYYDLVSWFRDRLAADLYTKYAPDLRKLFVGVEIRKADPMDTFGDTQREKTKKRNKLCEVYYKGITGGLDVTGIYTLYKDVRLESYNLCVHRGTTGGASDGVAYYDYKEIKAKTVAKNADKFKTDYEGFIALKELLEFLESTSNTTDITLFNIPVQIFRDPRYCKRFHSFSEYVELYNDVNTLVSEVDNDVKRSSLVDRERIYNNDAIYDSMCNSLAKEDDNYWLASMYSTQLSLGQTVVIDKRTSKAKIFHHRLEDIKKDWFKCSFRLDPAFLSESVLKEMYQMDSVKNRLVVLLSKYKYVYMYYVAIAKGMDKFNAGTKMVEVKNTSQNRFNLAVYCMDLTEQLIKLLGFKILDQDGFYNLFDGDLDYYLKPLGSSNNNASVVQMIMAVYKSSKQYLLSEIKGNWEDLRNSLTCAHVLKSFHCKLVTMLEKMDDMMRQCIEDKQSNLYLVYAEAIQAFPMMNQDFNPTTLRDLKLFFDDNNTLLPINVLLQDVIVLRQIQQLRDKVLLNCMVRYMQLCVKEREFITNVRRDIMSTLVISDKTTVVSKEIQSRLTSIDHSIMVTKSVNALASSLEDFATFASNNFMLSKNEVDLFQINERSFVHKNGYVVELVFGKQAAYNATAIDLEMLNMIKIMYTGV